MEMVDGVPYSYLGDGAYAKFDGYSIWLLANHHLNPTDTICLEPSVLRALISFAKEVGVLKGGEIGD